MNELKSANEMNILARKFNDNQAVDEVIGVLQQEIYERASKGEFYLDTKSLLGLSDSQLRIIAEKLRLLGYGFENLGGGREGLLGNKIIWGRSTDLGF